MLKRRFGFEILPSQRHDKSAPVCGRENTHSTCMEGLICFHTSFRNSRPETLPWVLHEILKTIKIFAYPSMVMLWFVHDTGPQTHAHYKHRWQESKWLPESQAGEIEWEKLVRGRPASCFQSFFNVLSPHVSASLMSIRAVLHPRVISWFNTNMSVRNENPSIIISIHPQ